MFDERVVGLMRRFQRQRQREGTGPTSVIDPSELLHEMRLIKTPRELELLRRAIDITCEGHLASIRTLRPGSYEYELEAEIGYAFRKNGSPRCGYATIVGSGANATVLHYTVNNCRIEDGDLVLIDAGAEFGYYTGDVTRTRPAGGRFTEVQAKLYQLVLDAQLQAIEAIKPGASFVEPHDIAVRVLTEGMVRIGLLEGEVEKLIEEGNKSQNQPDTPSGYKKFYMHRTSHWLGIDVHAPGSYQRADQWRPPAPGMG